MEPLNLSHKTRTVTLRVRRIIVPFSTVLFSHLLIDQVFMRNAYTFDKQIETIIGFIASYAAITVPVISIEL